MPRQQENDTPVATPAPTPTPGPGGALPTPGPGASFPSQFGLHGRQRWDTVKSTAPGVFAGPVAYRQWLEALPDDPSDPEYQAGLATERARFQKWWDAAGWAIPADVQGPNPYNQGKAPSFKDAMKKFQDYLAGQETPPNLDPGGVGPSGMSASGPLGPPVGEAGKGKSQAERQGDLQDKRELPQAKYLWEQPTFRGRPIGTDEIYNNGAVQDPFLQGFLDENGIQLSGDTRAKATRSGQYVLMGTETNKELGASRDVYMFVDDAKAAGQRLDPAKLAKYQAGLGLVVTSQMDPTLENYWDQAVEMAQRSAVAGIHMSVEEWFDLTVSSAIAKKHGAGGGGSEPMEANDYYRAMMQVLGDISGVEG